MDKKVLGKGLSALITKGPSEKEISSLEINLEGNIKNIDVISILENIQREELNAIEEAHAFKRLLEEFHLTQEAVAESVGKDRSTVTNLLRLLRLPEDIQKQVAGGKLSMGHARALLGIESAEAQKK